MHSYMHAPIQDDERLLFKTATVRSGLLCGLGRMLADHAKTHTLPTRPSRGDCCLVCVCVCPSLCMHARVMMRARSRPTTPGWSGAFQLTNTEAEAGRQAGLCVHAWKAHTHAHTHTHTHTQASARWRGTRTPQYSRTAACGRGRVRRLAPAGETGKTVTRPRIDVDCQ